MQIYIPEWFGFSDPAEAFSTVLAPEIATIIRSMLDRGDVILLATSLNPQGVAD
jgi:hypothetical protein